jgi:cell wall-associated NlpC family hydrolase
MSRARHRRPRKHPVTGPLALGAIVASTGPLGLAAAEAPAAEAAPSVDWDKVAACESGGNWAINTGNGFSGGLQFTASTWAAYGGTGRPQDAPRAQQIAVANRILAGQGLGAWPTCGPKGLRAANPPTSGRVDETTPPARAPKKAAPQAARPPAPRAAPQSHAPAPKPPTRPVPTPTAPTPASGHYTVRGGDTLTGIADAHHMTGGYRQLADLNAIKDIDLIYVGDELTVPAPSTPTQPTRRHTAAPPPIQMPTQPLSPRVPPLPTRPPVVSTRTHTTTVTRTDPTPARPTSHAAAADTSAIVATARGWIGTPYRWGGNTRAGVDCSGLVAQVFKAHGIIVPRTAAAQMDAAHPISRAEARPGDLVGDPAGTHIGIFVAPGLMIDAPDVGQSVGVHHIYSALTRYGRI